MLSILNSEFKSPHLNPLHDWFTEEWGERSFYNRHHEGYAILAPLIALDDEILVGGLAFSRFKNPENDGMALWINALLVALEQRGKGVASALLTAAAQAAFEWGETQLFALTDVPQLYLKQKWSLVEGTKDQNIVRLDLNGLQPIR
ncbi:MAG: GNAT family N-acetyltransferase [Alphaproteobacteria bacterium]|nr:GNAT family N-acetyltransferase [Alphaproteobacteria bacterium]